MDKVKIRIANGMHMESATRFNKDKDNKKIGVIKDRKRNSKAKEHLVHLGGDLKLYYEWAADKNDLTTPIL
jgi:hypothetical protein